MSKPKSSIRDYGYNPNQAISLRDMEDTVTTEGMRMAGKVEKHSEFMRPNENNDYSDMEYKYPYPSGTMPPTDWVGPGSGWPGNPSDCQGLWNKLFPKHKTGTGEFVPDRNDNIALDKYIKSGCPVDYIPTWCCPGVKISGPKEVDVSSTTQYSLTGAKVNCDYIWNASAGRIPGGTFYAPDSPQTVTISVEPFMGDDSSRVCNSMQVKVKSGGECGSATIGITSNQMNVGESQTLTIVNPNPGTSYTWAIASGGGSMSGATYTAAATNANCTNNPVIQLKAGVTVCATVSIAINAYTNPATQAYGVFSRYGCETEGGVTSCYTYYNIYNCAGALLGEGDRGQCQSGWDGRSCKPGEWTFPTGCGSGTWPGEGCCSLFSTCASHATVVDKRDAAMKAAGCCPAQLI